MKIQQISSPSENPWVNGLSHYKISNNNMYFCVSQLGGTITSIVVPDRNGNLADIALGFDDLYEYESCSFSPCSMVGRYANRISNGQVTINGKQIQLSQNDGKHHLHGGVKGFHRYVWTPEVLLNSMLEPHALRLSYNSCDGEEGFPGNLKASVQFELTEDNQLVITFTANSDQDTLCNLAAHMAINLSGNTAGSCLNHILKLNSDSYCETDAFGIPTGIVSPVDGTPMDFRYPQVLGEKLDFSHPQIQAVGGYDHNWNINGGGLKFCFDLYDPDSGRYMDCWTEMPCVHIYTANSLNGDTIGKNSTIYKKHCAFFTETQFAPDSPNHPEWEQPLLKKGEIYKKTTIYQFGVRNTR